MNYIKTTGLILGSLLLLSPMPHAAQSGSASSAGSAGSAPSESNCIPAGESATIPFHLLIMDNEYFRRGDVDTRFVERVMLAK